MDGVLFCVAFVDEDDDVFDDLDGSVSVVDDDFDLDLAVKVDDDDGDDDGGGVCACACASCCLRCCKLSAAAASTSKDGALDKISPLVSYPGLPGLPGLPILLSCEGIPGVANPS